MMAWIASIGSGGFSRRSTYLKDFLPVSECDAMYSLSNITERRSLIVHCQEIRRTLRKERRGRKTGMPGHNCT